MKEEAKAVAAKCGADIRVSSLAGDSAAVQRDVFLHIGQVVVSTPGQVAQVSCRVIQTSAIVPWVVPMQCPSSLPFFPPGSEQSFPSIPGSAEDRHHVHA